MAVDLSWDPAKLSRIVNELLVPTPEDRAAIAAYLQLSEAKLFGRKLTEKPSTRAVRKSA